MEKVVGRRWVVVRYQLNEWMVAVTEQLDENRRGVRRGSQLARNSQQTGHIRCFSDEEGECEPAKVLNEAFPNRVQALRL